MQRNILRMYNMRVLFAPWRFDPHERLRSEISHQGTRK